jgi:HlyD family secretion protein
MAQVWKKMMRYKLWIIIGIVVLIAVKVGTSLYTSKPQQTTTGHTEMVERGHIVSAVSATGTIKPVNMVDVSSKITGLIEEVKIAENQQVKAGDVLVILDDTRLQSQVAQAQARLANSAANYQRNEKLRSIGAVSQQQIEAAEMDYTIAQAAYDDAVSQLSETVIRAPIEGTVIGKPIPAGQTVAPGISSPMVLLTIADMSKMQIETQVDESDIGKVHLGQKVTFTVDASPDKIFTGVVSNVSSKANVQQNVVYYNVLIDVDAPADLLKPTMTARVSIAVGESNNTIIIPLSAVKSNNGQSYVIVMQDGKTKNAVKLAESFAEGGIKTIILDCNGRNPQLDKIFEVENKKGLSSMLINNDVSDEYFISSQYNNLYVLSWGEENMNPADAFAKNNMEDIVKILKEHLHTRYINCFP